MVDTSSSVDVDIIVDVDGAVDINNSMLEECNKMHFL